MSAQKPTSSPRQAGIIPPSVEALLSFHVRGYYKQTTDPAHHTAASRYIEALEKVVEDLKEVVRGLYREREAAARVIDHYIQKWEKDNFLVDDPEPNVAEQIQADLTDPSEYVPGL